jgi:hypothetical protein
MKTINELCTDMKGGNLEAPEFLKELTTYLENKEASDINKFFLLRSAVLRAHLPTIEQLIKHTNFVQTDKQGMTLLMNAAAKGHVEGNTLIFNPIMAILHYTLQLCRQLQRQPFLFY